MKTIFRSALFLLLAAVLAVGGIGPAHAQADDPQAVAAWSQVASLTAADGVTNDLLGSSIAMSADGSTIVAASTYKTVGANVQQGAVYVFAKPGGGWGNATSAVRLTSSDGAAGDSFSGSLAISGDGSTIVVGAPSKQVSGSAGPGEAYVFVKPAGAWASATETAKLTPSDGVNGDRFGSSVGASTDGSTIAVGETNKDMSTHTNQGAVYVFTKGSGAWASKTETAQLTASDGVAGDALGRSLAVSGNGSTIVSGSMWAADGAGALYLWVKPADAWANATQQAKLTGSDALDSDFNGSSVAISTDGATVVSGAPDKPNGANYFYGEAYVFVKPSGAWANATQKAILKTAAWPQYDFLGTGVAVNADGSAIAVGAPRQDPDPNPGQPSTYMYTRPGGGWANANESAALSVSGAPAYNALGTSVATTGTLTACGAPSATVGSNAKQGAVYVFASGKPASVTTVTSNPNFSWLGASVTFTATVAPASGSGTPTGTVVFNVDGSNKPAVTLASGHAAYTTSLLTVGPHILTATYSGDSTYAGSVSDPYQQRVSKYKYMIPCLKK